MDALTELVEPSVRTEDLAGIPCCFGDNAAQRVQWAFAARHLLHHVEAFAAECRRQAEPSSLRRMTRDRLKHMAKANMEHLDALRRLLAPLNADQIHAHDYFNFFAQNGGRPPELVSNYVNLHRDWAWDTDEQQQTFGLLRTLLVPGKALGKVLALGAGACRLPYDLHQSASPELTVATDVNPLLFLCAKKLLSGESLELFEFPVLPVDLESYALKRTLKASAPVGKNFHMVLTDATAPCFRPASFDTVLTAWFIDVVRMDIHDFFPLLNRLLKPGGTWLNLGPMMFPGQFARFYSLEETLAVAERAGFSIELQGQHRIPYLQSPVDCHHRVESVVAFRATKTADVDTLEAPPGEMPTEAPAWLVQSDKPVKLEGDLEAMALAHRLCSEILQRVDGQRSIEQVAAELAAKFDLPQDEIRALTLRCFGNIVQANQRNPMPGKR